MGADQRIRLAEGTLVLRGTEEAKRDLVQLVEAHAPRSFTGVTEADRAPVFAKASPLRGAAARRHALRRLWGQPLPRVREYENLRWLAEHAFQVPRALAAGALWRGGLPRYQALILEEVSGAQELDAALAGKLDGPPNSAGESPLERADDESRRSLARELGGEVGRMHALGFIHRDLFPRNLLVLPPTAAQRIVFVDAWRAAPNASLRGPAYDLACLLLEGMDLWSTPEQQVLLEAYVRARVDHGRPARRDLLPAARRHREALLVRLQREPVRLRGQALPGPWNEALRWPRQA
ncbi:lipopolysaccharide kinase InaA family protein [Planctomycetota bacterium]|nr:lipopolysaccharide kinase InaA family protein [Planctomycetota bacterium]